jgi:hypothetical protein
VLRRSAPLAAALLLLAPFTSSCSSDTPSLQLDITVGQEKDAFSQDPRVVSVEVRGINPLGLPVVVATTTPGGKLDFGDVTSDAQLTFEVTGVDAEGKTVVRGRSLGAIPLNALTGRLEVFAQRVNQWARPPGGLLQTHVGGVASVAAERYLVLGGGTIGKGDKVDEAEVYDLLALGGLALGGLTSQPETLVPRGTAMLFASHKSGTSIDFASGDGSEIKAPTGLASFAAIAGGRPVDASDGRTFVVGGTRPTEPTKSVLVVAADGTLSALDLVEARAGAAAVWVEGVGLVVAGGSATGAGVEVLGPRAASFAALSFPADATVGAGAVIDGPSGVVLLGGTLEDGTPAPIRRLDPTCVNACAATVVTNSDPSVDLTAVHAYTLGGGRILAVGEAITAPLQTHSFIIQLGTSATELPLREPRSGAAVVPAPNGTLALFGGNRLDGKPALSVELLAPQ